jgi:integrase
MSKGSITPLGPKKWKVRAQSRDSRTRRKVSRSRVVHGSEAQAQRVLRDLLQEVRDGAKPRRLQLRTYASSWIASRAKLVAAEQMKPSVLKKYATSLDLHILPVLGDMYMDALTHDDVAQYVSDRLASGVSCAGNTVLNELRLLRTMARDSFAAGVAPRHWADRVKAPEGRVYDEDDPNALTAQQLGHLIEEIPPQWLTVFGTLAFTGMRWSEVSALRWEDLDHRAGEIRVRRGNWKGQLVATKTKRSRRRIPIPPYLVPPRPDTTGYIFLTAAGTLHKGTPLNKVIRRALARARERLYRAEAGRACEVCADRKPPPAKRPPAHDCPYLSEEARRLMPVMTPHGLRRTYNDLLRAVAPELVVRALQGWASGAMPAHYATVRADERKLAADRARQLVGVTTPPAKVEPSSGWSANGVSDE